MCWYRVETKSVHLEIRVDQSSDFQRPVLILIDFIAVSFVADGSGSSTIFTTGGSKDINDISEWSFTDQLGGLPDKDNLTNGYAAAYFDGDDLTIYFGADRFANDGDAQTGFWFFQSRVQAIGGRFVGPDGVTPAVHTVGDILVLANLTNGGATVTAQVFKWVGGSNPLQLLASDLDARCGTNADPNVCAISNQGGETSPWSYTPTSGTPNIFRSSASSRAGSTCRRPERAARMLLVLPRGNAIVAVAQRDPPRLGGQ